MLAETSVDAPEDTNGEDTGADIGDDTTVELDSAAADVATEETEVATADASVDTFVPPVPTCLDDAFVAADDAAEADAVTDADDAATDALDDTPEAAPPCTTFRVRIVASNLTSGTNQNYEAPGIRILQALKPDIALMQEFRYPAGLRALVDTAFGPTFQYMVEPDPGNIPNGIVSRYPILESGEWDDPDLTDRDFAWARIDVPGPIDLWAVSVHLRTTSSTARDVEAKNLLAYIKAKVPAGAYLVVGGDMNTSVETEQALVDFSELLNVSAFAVDQAGSNKTNTTRSKPYDWVLPSTSLFARMIPVQLGAHTFPMGLVFDTRVYSPLSEAPPALSTDSAASNMQHMAVVRDFALGG